MRRLTLAAICGVLAISACTSDDRSPSPTEPGPEAVTAPRCRPTPFPVLSLTNQIIRIFPVSGGLQANALVRMAAIGAFWTVCKPTEAQTGVASFVKFMVQQFQANKLIGGKNAASTQRVITLTNDLYKAVGLTPPNFSPEAVGDGNNFGNGLFIPGQQAIIKTGNNEAGTLIPADGFTQPTLITIFKRTTSGFSSPPQPVFAPFFEISASNASGTHYLTGTQTAVVGFCADADFLATLSSPAIAHQAVAEGSNPGGFEILNNANSTQYASLGLACPQAPARIGALDFGSFKGFALSAWKRAAQYVTPAVQSLLLPDEARAAAVMVAGKSGLGGLARSLSPFAVTNRSAPAPNHISVIVDPSANYYFPFKDFNTCVGGCPPVVRILTPANTQTGAGTSIHVTLLKVDAPEGEIVFSGTKDQTVQNFSSEGSDLKAVFPGLHVDVPGTYRLIFSAPGVTSDTTDAFHVYTLAFSVQPSDGETVLDPFDFLGQEVEGFDFPVVQISIVDWHGVRAAGTTARIHMSSSNGNLTGDTNVHANDGIANFTRIMDSETIIQEGLRISTDQLLEDMTLNAAVIEEVCPCGVIPLVTSDPFTVDGGD